MGEHPRILLVEDDLQVGSVMAEQLEAAHFVVDGPYRTLADGSAALTEHFPDAAVLDVKLHDRDAFLLAGDLELYGIPFVLCSGLDLSGRVGRDFGHHPFVRKGSYRTIGAGTGWPVRRRWRDDAIRSAVKGL